MCLCTRWEAAFLVLIIQVATEKMMVVVVNGLGWQSEVVMTISAAIISVFRHHCEIVWNSTADLEQPRWYIHTVGPFSHTVVITFHENTWHSSPSPLILSLPSHSPRPPLLNCVERGAQWAKWIHFNWQVPVALWPRYVQWVMHEGPTWVGFQWGMTLPGANGVCVDECVFVHTCICSSNLTWNEHWQS